MCFGSGFSLGGTMHVCVHTCVSSRSVDGEMNRKQKYTHLPHFRPAIGIPPKCRCVWEFNVYLEWPPLLCNTVVMTDTPSPLSGDTDVKTQQKHSRNQPPTNTCRHTYAQQRIKTAVLNITRVRQRGLSINHPSHT